MPVLRCGSHNANGLTAGSRVALAAADWLRAGYHLVLIQETHLTLFSAVRVQQQLARLGWTCYFAHSPPGPAGRPRGGTAILVRSALVRDGTFTVAGGDAAVERHAEGRYIAMPVRWCGHRLHVCSIYMPNDSTQQRQLIANVLRPLAASAGTQQLLWGGDFNFVPSLQLDRLHPGGGGHHPDPGTQRRWQEALPDLLDSFRARHPGRRSYTYLRAGTASRLDRIYISPLLLPHLAVCAVRDRSFSDHRPVSLTLVGLQPSTFGPGLRRVRTGFLSSPPLLRQLQVWLGQQLQAAPAVEDHHGMLIWWPYFKRSLAAKCGELQRATRLLSEQAEAAGAQLEALHQRLDGGEAAVLPDIIAARQQFVAASRVSLGDAALRQRQVWWHRGERPCPGLTRRLRPPQRDRIVPALRSTNGDLLHSGSACAQRTANFWAGISARPATDPAAQREVLAALAGGRQLSAEQAEALATQAIQPVEVKHSMRSAPSGKSPGPDGIPLELYRQCKATFIPLLARLFTAIATLGDLPTGFHEGLITVIYKSGERSDPANYRPITLLGTDYRLYAKLLARRLNPCLSGIVDPEQTAFIPGRSIGENIMLLQCLPHLLRRPGEAAGEARSAVVAFCDFRKAYDTVDREFLFRTMHALGVGPGFIAMARLLLTNTKARALVNGHISTPAAFAAGVRQGCPLAPLLYLFVAQALLRLLKARGIGIAVAGTHLTATQYADDTEALLTSTEQVPAFLAAMNIFGDASGQRLNPAKTVLLPIGEPQPALPPTVHGLRVVSTATALGLAFASAGDPPPDWPTLVGGVERCYGRLACRDMSVFGRGFASAAYGVSKILYHAEFGGMPPIATLERLQAITAKVVDRGQAPTDTTRRFAGLAGWALPGRPCEGGFGTLPLVEHIYSRHARWCLHLIVGAADVPWIAVARALLHRCASEVAAHPLGLLMWQPDAFLPGMAAPLPPPLRRLQVGLHRLPPAAHVAATPLALGHWCWAAPLWGNPFFASPLHPDGIDHPFFDFAAAGISTLGQLLHLQQALAAVASQAAYTLVRFAQLGGSYAFAERHVAVERTGALLAALPAGWVAAARAAALALAAGQLAPPLPADALQAMLPQLGWRWLGQPLQLADCTVRQGTDLQLGPMWQRRRQQYLEPYAALAVDGAVGPADELLGLLRRLWRVRWENQHKEPFWRLVYNALPTAARLHLDQPCRCGAAAAADRHHHFWECPIAQAVVAAISTASAATGQLPPAAPLSKPSIWLARAPAAVHSGVWDVVSLSAIAAMDHGRRRMYALSLGPPPPTPLHITASRSAVARFWVLLTDFVAQRCSPASWRDTLPPGHPFICFDPASGTFVVNRPAADPPPPDE